MQQTGIGVTKTEPAHPARFSLCENRTPSQSAIFLGISEHAVYPAHLKQVGVFSQ